LESGFAGIFDLDASASPYKNKELEDRKPNSRPTLSAENTRVETGDNVIKGEIPFIDKRNYVPGLHLFLLKIVL
jgi:hypothetical protein